MLTPVDDMRYSTASYSPQCLVLYLSRRGRGHCQLDADVASASSEDDVRLRFLTPSLLSSIRKPLARGPHVSAAQNLTFTDNGDSQSRHDTLHMCRLSSPSHHHVQRPRRPEPRHYSHAKGSRRGGTFTSDTDFRPQSTRRAHISAHGPPSILGEHELA